MKKVLLDGGVGTSLWELAQEHNLPKDPVWKYVLEHPEIVSELHAGMIAAGAKIILADTFGANGPAVRRSSGYEPCEVVTKAMELALEAVDGTDVKAFLPFGPLSMLLEPYGDLEEDECEEIYSEVIDAGVKAGAHGIYLQTFMDVEMMKIAVRVARRHDIPVFSSMSFEGKGRTMMGNSVEDFVRAVVPLGVDAIGMNCSLGPVEAVPIIREFTEYTDLPLIFKPNSGKPQVGPDGKTVALYSAGQFAEEVKPAIEVATYIGGCCGCNAEYIKELNQLLTEE